MKKILFTFLIIFISFSLINCKKKNVIKGEAREKILAYANPIVDKLLEGLNEDDYTKYTADFDEQMKNAMPENVFKQTRTTIINKIGKYVSRKLKKVYKKDQYIFVKYIGKFENEEKVKIKVVFQKIGDKQYVSGLWFNSPKLRQ